MVETLSVSRPWTVTRRLRTRQVCVRSLSVNASSFFSWAVSWVTNTSRQSLLHALLSSCSLTAAEWRRFVWAQKGANKLILLYNIAHFTPSVLAKAATMACCHQPLNLIMRNASHIAIVDIRRSRHKMICFDFLRNGTTIDPTISKFISILETRSPPISGQAKCRATKIRP